MFIELDNNEKKIKETIALKDKTLDENKKMVKDWCKLFLIHNKRPPTEEEILDQLKDKLDMQTLKNIIQDNKQDNVFNV
ncbi:MAG: hypothetical protein EB114_13090 [Betaproteobacteria bacterium]|nr:hypothetical protein [Betaproteobacteria bacterium]